MSETGFHVGVAALYTTYSAFIFGVSAWGYFQLDSECTDPTIRLNFIYLISLSVAMLIAYFSYGVCNVTCHFNEMVEEVPTWLVLFTLVASTSCIGLMGSILSKIKKVPCQLSRNYSTTLGYTMAVTVLCVIVMIGVLFYRARQSSSGARKQRVPYDKQSREHDTRLRKAQLLEQDSARKLEEQQQRATEYKLRSDADSAEKYARNRQLEVEQLEKRNQDMSVQLKRPSAPVAPSDLSRLPRHRSPVEHSEDSLEAISEEIRPFVNIQRGSKRRAPKQD